MDTINIPAKVTTFSVDNAVAFRGASVYAWDIMRPNGHYYLGNGDDSKCNALNTDIEFIANPEETSQAPYICGKGFRGYSSIVLAMAKTQRQEYACSNAGNNCYLTLTKHYGLMRTDVVEVGTWPDALTTELVSSQRAKSILPITATTFGLINEVLSPMLRALLPVSLMSNAARNTLGLMTNLANNVRVRQHSAPHGMFDMTEYMHLLAELHHLYSEAHSASRIGSIVAGFHYLFNPFSTGEVNLPWARIGGAISEWLNSSLFDSVLDCDDTPEGRLYAWDSLLNEWAFDVVMGSLSSDIFERPNLAHIDSRLHVTRSGIELLEV